MFPCIDTSPLPRTKIKKKSKKHSQSSIALMKSWSPDDSAKTKRIG